MAAAIPIVFIHGLKGSHLKDGSGNRRYVTASQLFGLSDDKIPLPLHRDEATGAQDSDSLVPDGSIRDIKICCCVAQSFYGPFVRHFSQKQGHSLFYEFSYDWRRDLTETSGIFEKYLEDIVKKHFPNRAQAAGAGRKGVQVVAHSMGCLITFPIVNRRADLFHSCLFAAGAMGPLFAFLPDVSELGGKNMMGPFNRTMLTPERWLGWPSLWSFFPLESDREDDRLRAQDDTAGLPWLAEADGAEVPMDFHNLTDWKRLKLGPYHPRSGIAKEALTPEAESFLAETLARAKAYRETGMVYKSDVQYPPIACLRAVHTDGAGKDPCLRQVRRLSPDGTFDFGSLATVVHAPGDDVIQKSAALPPRGVPVLKVVDVALEHSQVLSDISAVEGLLFALDAAARGTE